jgi:hypothetical protein
MYWMGEWELMHFKPAACADKKYTAVLKERISDRTVEIDFGRPGFKQFQDVTGLGLYSHLDHKSAERRQKFRDRCAKFVQADVYTPGYFSYHFLW